MALSFLVDPAVALVRGYDRLAMTLSNWGNTDTGPGGSADAQSTNTGTQSYSLAGIAIHPNSDVDRFGFQSLVTNEEQTVTPESPFVGDIPGPWKGAATNDSRFPASYHPVNSNVATPFGFVMGADPTGVPIFGGSQGNLITPRYPTLRLIVFLRPPQIIPAALAPYVDVGNAMAVPAVAGTILRVLDVGGRRRLRAVFKRTAAAGSCDVQLTGMLVGGITPNEFALTAAQTMAAADVEATFDFVVPPNVKWLLVKTTLNAGAPVISWLIQLY